MNIFRSLDSISSAIDYLIATKIRRKTVPFIAGLVLGENCNLNCQHCHVARYGRENDLSFDEVRSGITLLYDKGVKLLAITGGEPFIWKDGHYDLEDVIALARKTGFKVVSVYTNGTCRLESSADVIFVSIDGLKESSNKLRGDIYDRVIKNINQSSHSNIIINCTINNLNKHELEAICEYASSIANVRGLFFYFHTPYYGKDALFIPFSERQKIVQKLIVLKRRYRILNSIAALKDVYYDRWERPTDLCQVFAYNKIFKCCRSNGDPDVCKECGYLGYPEIINITKLRPSAVWSALSYLPR